MSHAIKFGFNISREDLGRVSFLISLKFRVLKNVYHRTMKNFRYNSRINKYLIGEIISFHVATVSILTLRL